MSKGTAAGVGIDLGTTQSRVAVFRQGRLELVTDERGKSSVPSYVAFTSREGRLVGQSAKGQEKANPSRTIFNVKRLMGMRYDEPEIRAYAKLWPFEIVDEGGVPKIRLDLDKESRLLFPEEVSAAILSKLKDMTEAFLGESVANVVVAVPASFTDSQRQATKDACSVAGLNVLRLIGETTAAALAFDHARKTKKKTEQEKEKEGKGKGNGQPENILVFDLGGGTFDATVLTLNPTSTTTTTDGGSGRHGSDSSGGGGGSRFQVRATSGDSHLGGEDFTARLLEHFARDLKRTSGRQVAGNRPALRRLATACERAKRSLSWSDRAEVTVESLADGFDFSASVSRRDFEAMNEDLFSDLMDCVERALTESGLGVSDVSEVLVVGESTKIPRVRNLLRQYFRCKPLNKSLNSEEAVAFGAAIQASMYARNGRPRGSGSPALFRDVTPISLGIETAGGIMNFLIRRNTPVPTTQMQMFTTFDRNQDRVLIQVFEGESQHTGLNSLLGTFELSGIAHHGGGGGGGGVEENEAGEQEQDRPEIQVTFSIDADGITNVSAGVGGTDSAGVITIVRDKGGPTNDRLKEMKKETDRYKEADRQASRRRLESYTAGARVKVKDGKFDRPEVAKEREAVLLMCKEVTEWLGINPLAPRHEYESRRRELERALVKLISRVERSEGGQRPVAP